MTDQLSPLDQNELIREVGLMLLSEPPQGWRELELTFRSTVAIDTATFLCTTQSGEQVRLAPPTKALRLLKKLRQGMYLEGKGTWFTARMTIQPPGRYQINYDYDSEPIFVPPLTADAYALDFQYFPRSEETTPGWLRQKLIEASEQENKNQQPNN